MNEFIPVLAGAFAGLLTSSLGARPRSILSWLVAALAGAALTLISGEYHAGWIYVALDAALAVGGMLALQAARRATRRRAAA
jgi:hypothetical protein